MEYRAKPGFQRPRSGETRVDQASGRPVTTPRSDIPQMCLGEIPLTHRRESVASGDLRGKDIDGFRSALAFPVSEHSPVAPSSPSCCAGQAQAEEEPPVLHRPLQPVLCIALRAQTAGRKLRPGCLHSVARMCLHVGS